jgi:hypothetical protein
MRAENREIIASLTFSCVAELLDYSMLELSLGLGGLHYYGDARFNRSGDLPETFD